MTNTAGWKGVICFDCSQNGQREPVDSVLNDDGTISHWTHRDAALDADHEATACVMHGAP